MDSALEHVSNNWQIYSFLVAIISFAALYWLSKYFATQQELLAQKTALEAHIKIFNEHQNDHRKLRDLVHEIRGDLKTLPTAKENADLRESIATLNGRLQGMEPLFKQLLNNDKMLFENELRGDKS